MENAPAPLSSKHSRGPKEPRYIGFTQQELPACRPLLTPAWVIGIFLSVGILFLPLGAACLTAALSVKEISLRYDERCISGDTNTERDAALLLAGGNGTICNLTLPVSTEMKAPIYVYYELDKFYQNHRRYVRSRDDAQLRGQARNGGNLDACEPERYLGGNTSAVIDPCGLVAWSLFNDSYTMQVGPTPLPVSTSGIAWHTDLAKKFSGTAQPANFNTEPGLRGGAALPAAPLNSNERFVVWMRTAALPSFRKLWGIINQDISADTLVTVSIQNAYNSYRYGGRKFVVLSTSSWLGGHNTFLGIAYIVVGGASVFCSIVFFIIQSTFPRALGDISRLSFRKQCMQPGIDSQHIQ